MPPDSPLLNQILVEIREVNKQVSDVDKATTTNTTDLKWIKQTLGDNAKALKNVAGCVQDCHDEMDPRINALESWKDQIRAGWKTLLAVAVILGFLAGAGVFGSNILENILGG